MEEKWEYFAEKSTIPEEDNEDEVRTVSMVLRS
jgi:hypothetical protein